MPQVFAVVEWEKRGGEDLPIYPPSDRVEKRSLTSIMHVGKQNSDGKEICAIQFQGKLWEGYIDNLHSK